MIKKFTFSDFYSTTLISLIMTLNLIFNLILLLFSYIEPIISILFVLFMVIIVLLILKILKHPEIPNFWGEYFGTTLEATNVIVKIPAINIPEEKASNLVLSAHIDSKSQTYNTFWRVFFYKLWLFSGIALGFFYILFLIVFYLNLSFNYRITLYGAWFSVILISTSNIFLLFLNTTNKSPGALDNASGMAIVFELSSYFLQNPLKNFNIWLCQFSAEELGTMGSRIFVNEYESLFNKNGVLQINFDMVSCAYHEKNRIEYFNSYGVLIRRIIAPILSNYLERAAKVENLQIKGFHLSTGAHTDTVPFHLRRYEAIDITTKAAAKFSHTKYDTPDKVDPRVLAETCRLIRRTVLMIDNNFEKIKSKCFK